MRKGFETADAADPAGGGSRRSAGKLRVGLTGSPGSGKSTVARGLGKRGVTVIDMDRAGRRVVERDAGVRDEIRAAFGSSVFTAAGSVNRRELGAIVFRDAALRRELDRIVHPPMLARVRELMERALRDPSPIPYIVVDSALIFELEIRSDYDLVVAVVAPLEQRLSRSARQRGVDRGEILRRTRAQWSQERKAAAADLLLHNDAGLAELEQRIEKLHGSLLEAAEERSGPQA